MPSLIFKLPLNTIGIKLTCLIVFLIAISGAYAQAPNITYTTPQSYTLNSTITPLVPVNTGGAVPANTYGQVSTYSGTGVRGNISATLNTSTFYQPRKMAVDATGNMYVLDDNNFVRKITPNGIVTQFAGSGAVGSADGIGIAATFYNPIGIAVDAAGNVYLADSNNNRIRKITPQGVVTTLAGSGAQGSTNGTGSAASFKSPNGIIADAIGNLYVADLYNNMIRKVTPLGVVTTFAGNSSYGFNNGTGTLASFSGPCDLTIDNAGNIYVADEANHAIRKITPAGVVTTLAGNGSEGSANGTGTAARFNFPTSITFDGYNLYVSDAFNQIIRKVTLAGEVSTIAGSGNMGFVNGVGTAASFSYPYGIGADRAGNVYVADNQNQSIRKIALTGYQIDKALPAGLSFDAATGVITGTPTAISPSIIYTITAYNTSGSSTATVTIAVNAAATTVMPPNLSYQTPQSYVINMAIGTLAPNNTGGVVPANIYGLVTTYAGGRAPVTYDSTGPDAGFNFPSGVTTSSSGNIFTTDYGSGAIRKITSATVVNTIGNVTSPSGIVADANDNLFVTAFQSNIIYKIAADGTKTVFAGSGTAASVDGVGATASFNGPGGITKDKQGNLYVADQLGNKIRKITPAGVVTTIAGNGVAGFVNGIAAAASFNNPDGVAVDDNGNIYVADTKNNLIRKITLTGVVSTLAGSGAAGSANSTGTAASFNYPTGVAVDVLSNVFVADYNNALIRKITPAGVVTTVAGNIVKGSSNAIGTAASFSGPLFLAFNVSGDIYVTDATNNLIRKLSLNGYTIDKPLPTGLVFDAKTGIISGTPTVMSPATIYTITGYNAGGGSTSTVSIAVTANTMQSSVITFPLLQPVLDADANFNPGATSTNHETPITYTSSNPNVAVVLPNWLVHVIAVGTTIITANQAGNVNYSAAIPVFQTLYVTQQEEIYFPNLPAKILGDIDFEPGAISNVSAFPVTYTSSNPNVATVINGKIHIVGIGTAIITASQAGNTVYIAATPVSRTLTVNSPLVFNPLAVKNTCDIDFNAGATSTFPIIYSSSNAAVATIVNSKIHITGVGVATITATSNGLSLTQQLQVTAVLPPTVSIDASLPNPVCTGSNVRFTANVGNAGTNPSYQWQVNGINTGNNLPDYSNATLRNNDIITCIVTNNSTTCLAAPTVVSNPIQMQVNALNTSTIAILYDNTPVCAGNTITLQAQSTSEGSTPIYQWQVNGINAGTNSKIFMAPLKNNDQVTCTLISSISCSVPVVSTPVTIKTNALPEVSFRNNLTINQGDNVQLKPLVSSNVIEYLWSPSTGLSDASSASPVAKPAVTTKYQLRVKTADGCYAYNIVTVNVINPIVIYNTFTPNGDNVNDTWEIPMLAYYPNCIMTISNRYGTLIYQSRGYARGWDGTRNGQPLPVGTYYYIIDLKDGKQPQAGSVTILR